jgi:mannose-6-phosphate isomerase-like protein (cupin superfamily)
MKKLLFFVAVLLAASSFDTRAQQPPVQQQPPPAQQQPPPPPQKQPPAAPTKKPQPRGPRTATFAILVTGPDGAQIPNVSVTVTGPASRTVRTEGGRIALENLPLGNYQLRFDRDGFVPLERELTARAGAPIEVKVTLTPMPAPPAPPPPPPAPPAKAPSDAKPASFDVPGVAEKEFVRRGAPKTTPLVCGDEGNATLVQINDPLAQHTHVDADEFIYVVAGEGAATVNGTEQRLRAGVLVFVPRGVSHALSKAGRNPLIVMSTRAGGECGG